MNVVKQEIVRVNLNNLGISELKWTGMGEFNSDDQYIYYCGQKSLRKNAVALPVSLPDKLLQSRPTLSNPMNCSLTGSSVHGILQARIQEWIAVFSFKEFSKLRD